MENLPSAFEEDKDSSLTFTIVTLGTGSFDLSSIMRPSKRTNDCPLETKNARKKAIV
jgi:hypothetical protein